MEVSPRYPGWRVVGACFVMAVFVWGFGFYGQGVYLAALQRQHHWSPSLISGASTAYYLFSAVLLLFVGDALKRFGPRRVVLTGILCMAMAAALVGRLTEPWQVYPVYALMAVGWASATTVAITTIVGTWFNQRRGLAITIALSGASCGGIVVTPILVAFIAAIGFSRAMPYAAGVMVLVLVPMVFFLLRLPPAVSPDTASQAPVFESPWTRRRALRDGGFVTIAVAFALVLFSQVGFLVHQIAFLQPRIGEVEAGLAVSITAISALVGRAAVGAVIDRLSPRPVSAIAFLSQAAALVVLVWTSHPAILLGACAVFGFSVGNAITLPAIIIHHEFEANAFPVLIAFAMAFAQFIDAFGPGTLGWLRTLTGSYDLPLLLCAALHTAGAGILLTGLRPRKSA